MFSRCCCIASSNRLCDRNKMSVAASLKASINYAIEESCISIETLMMNNFSLLWNIAFGTYKVAVHVETYAYLHCLLLTVYRVHRLDPSCHRRRHFLPLHWKTLENQPPVFLSCDLKYHPAVLILVNPARFFPCRMEIVEG